MKKGSLVLGMASFFTLFSVGLSAQFAVRPYIGLNSSKLTEEFVTEGEIKSDLGFQIGVDFQIGDEWYIQPGVQFEALNNSKIFMPSSAESSTNYELSRSYLRLPVMAGYRLGEPDGVFAFRIFTGPNVAFKLSGKVGDEDGNLPEEDLAENLKSAIFGWNAGVGVNLIKFLFVDVGYQIGLSKVFQEMEGLNSGARNNLFYANMGLRLNF